MRVLLKIFIISSVLFLCHSCGMSRLKIPKNQVKTVGIGFKGTFKNMNATDSSHTLASLFGIYKEEPENISIEITSNKELKISYIDSLGKKQTNFLKGKLHKKGYFQHFVFKERIQIPPIFSIIYGKVNINRIRLALTQQNNLVIDSYYNSGGNIFILAGGYFHRHPYYFEPTKSNI